MALCRILLCLYIFLILLRPLPFLEEMLQPFQKTDIIGIAGRDNLAYLLIHFLRILHKICDHAVDQGICRLRKCCQTQMFEVVAEHISSMLIQTFQPFLQPVHTHRLLIQFNLQLMQTPLDARRIEKGTNLIDHAGDHRHCEKAADQPPEGQK